MAAVCKAGNCRVCGKISARNPGVSYVVEKLPARIFPAFIREWGAAADVLDEPGKGIVL